MSLSYSSSSEEEDIGPIAEGENIEDYLQALKTARRNKEWKRMIRFMEGRKPASEMEEHLLVKCVERDPFCIRYIPTELLKDEFCFAALEKDSSVFSILPDEKKTEEVCECAIFYDAKNIVFVPEKHKKLFE